MERAAFLGGRARTRTPHRRNGGVRFLRGEAPGGFGGVTPSYRPGVRPVDLNNVLPPFVAAGIRDGLQAFGRQIKGFDREDAVLTGVGNATRARRFVFCAARGWRASPAPGSIRSAKGRGYAGGIVSAAIDGMKAAERIVSRYAPPERVV
jgi:uncharacterized FAD-dependent dehydrogenase